jgi:polyisoprenoid-binding protein YceI
MKSPMYRMSAAVVTLLSLLTVPTHAGDKYQIAEAEVVVVCPLTVGGSFEARTKEVAGDIIPPTDRKGPVGGTLRVNLHKLETGIALRDRHMRDNYLEVERGTDFATATLSGIEVDGVEGKQAFRAVLALHGQTKPVIGVAEVHFRDGRYRIEAQFSLRVSDYQIPTPTYLSIGVRDELKVRVKFTAT